MGIPSNGTDPSWSWFDVESQSESAGEAMPILEFRSSSLDQDR